MLNVKFVPEKERNYNLLINFDLNKKVGSRAPEITVIEELN